MPTAIQKQIIRDLGVPKDFFVIDEYRIRLNFLRSYIADSGVKSLVLGISGGIDSTTAGMLAQRAVESLRKDGYECEFIAVRLPYGEQADEVEAWAAIEAINPDKAVTINIQNATDAIMFDLGSSLHAVNNYHFIKGNVKARQRMIAQYALAGINSGLVIGTDHAAEGVMGFFTKFGDGAADILPLAGLNKRRVRALATFMGVPDTLVNKTPTADLEDDKPQLPDEASFGVTYDQIDDFLEGKDIDTTAHDIIVKAYVKTAHKRALPVTP